MPLARIITRTPQDAVAAAEYLRSQGYMVETVSPEEFRITPAEVELQLNRCSSAEAVERAQALLASHGAAEASAEVTAPPAVVPPQEGEIVLAYDITGRPVEYADQEQIQRRQKPGNWWRALAAGLAGVRQSVRRPALDLQRKRAEQRALKLEAEAAREREEIRRGEELARERERQEMERQRQEAERAERQRQEEITAERERARVAALHEAMIAAQRAATPPQPSPVAKPEAVPIIAAEEAEDNPNLLPAPAEPASETQPAEQAVRPQPPRRPPHAQRLPVRRRPMVISRAAVVTACGLSVLLLLGFVAYANRRSASPLAPGALMKDVKQNVPFGAATIAPPPAAPKPVVAAPAGRPSPTVRPANQKPPAARHGARQLRRPSQDSLAEDEVVVRHFTPPRARPQPSTAKLKRYSDRD